MKYQVEFTTKAGAPGTESYGDCKDAGMAFAKCQKAHPECTMIRATAMSGLPPYCATMEHEYPTLIQRDPIKEPRAARGVKAHRSTRGRHAVLREGKAPMKLHLSENAPNTELDSYSQETSLCDSIIAGGVILFLTSVLVLGIICAFSAYSKITVPPKEEYVIQSAFIEVIP